MINPNTQETPMFILGLLAHWEPKNLNPNSNPNLNSTEPMQQYEVKGQFCPPDKVT